MYTSIIILLALEKLHYFLDSKSFFPSFSVKSMLSNYFVTRISYQVAHVFFHMP